MGRTVAFFSYTRADDASAKGRLSDIRARLERCLCDELGEDVEVFQDTDDIKQGADWNARLRQALGSAVFLIPIVTPRWFGSGACQWELEKFRAKEQETGEEGLILPVYWLRDRWLESGQVQGHAGRAFIGTRQWEDWRELRRPLSRPEELEDAILRLAEDIADRLHERDLRPEPVATPEPEPEAPGAAVWPILPPFDPAAPETSRKARLEVMKRNVGNWASPIIKPSKPAGLIEIEGTYPEPLSIFRDALEGGGQGPEMVMMPTGDFMMGSPADEHGRYDDEGPRHRVMIDRPFALARDAVSFAEYDAFCAATGRDKPDDKGWGRGRRPVINVSWHDAGEYCAWLAKLSGAPYRLPSEAEWEYACRAGSDTPFEPVVAHTHGGASLLTSEANFDGNHPYRTGKKGEYRQKTLPVDYPGFRANGWGLRQMHGNVWEWCADTWAGSYETPRTQQAFMDGESYRVIRGGSWSGDAWYCRAACRNVRQPAFRDDNLGFRPARGQAS